MKFRDAVNGLGEQCRRCVVFLIPVLIALGGLQPERAGEVDDHGAGIQKRLREVHGNFGRSGEQHGLQALGGNRFRRCVRAAKAGLAHQFGVVARIVPMLQQDRLTVRVPPQNSHRFRAAVPPEPNNSDRCTHDYLFTNMYKYTTASAKTPAQSVP